MNKKSLLYIALFTIIVCSIFVIYNPNIAADDTGEFSDGEVFTPEGNQYDFKNFTINCTNTKNFTTRTIITGHTQFVDDTGTKIINYIELNKLIPSNKDKIKSFLDKELKKTSWTVDGVCVHEINFVFYDNFYSAYYKNSTSDVIMYISTTNEKDTADMMNSVTFKEV